MILGIMIELMTAKITAIGAGEVGSGVVVGRTRRCLTRVF
jgi:hypothetical protein